MFREITIGQYYPAESRMHRLDPRVKLMWVVVYITVLFLIKNPWLYLGMLILTLVLYRLSNVPFSFFMKGLKAIIVLLLFTFFLRLIATPGREIGSFWIFTFTDRGVTSAIRMTARLALMLTTASLLGYTTTPYEMANGIEKAFSFLKKFGVPMQDLSMIVMIAFRFIPIMFEDINSLMDAQASRGVEFENVSVAKKTRNVIYLLKPLFMSTISRSSDLAVAMEARGYDGEESTQMYPLVYTGADKLCYILMFALLACAIVGRILL